MGMALVPPPPYRVPTCGRDDAVVLPLPSAASADSAPRVGQSVMSVPVSNAIRRRVPPRWRQWPIPRIMRGLLL